ncbi:VOC family protein [Actinophytocola sediminis]
MASRLNPYLTFAGDAKQAMEFYRTVFGGNLTVNTFGEFGDAGSPNADQVMHAMLETDNGFTLMASDTPPGATHEPGNAITVSLSGDDTDVLHAYWDQLSDGATVHIALEKQMWGDEFGQLVDRFGVPWMVNIAQPQG